MVTVRCDLVNDVLDRTHRYFDGRTRDETWDSDALYRVNAAAGRGNFNDTPSGKRLGRYR
jgi:hypothetical protein